MFRKALLLAAGRGSRLGRATAEIPKPMLRVRGKPVLERHVEQLAAAGVEEIWINLHHQGHVIREHCGDGSRWGVRIRYSEEPELLGTAGALKNLEREFAAGDFFVVYGDNVGWCDYRALAAAHRPGTLLTIALYHNEDAASSGIAELADDGRITRFIEKPGPDQRFSTLVNAGFYAGSPALLPLLADGASDFGRDVIPALVSARRPVRGFVLSTPVAGIDTPELLARAGVLGVAVIGAGRMGARRSAVAAAGGCRVVWIIDPDTTRAQHVAAEHRARSAADYHAALDDPQVDCVIVSTTNDQLAPISCAAIEAGKHVLVEKPAARSAAELEPLVGRAAEKRVVFKAGLNYRHHPAIRRAWELLRRDEIGRLLHVVARHGHGGRLGLEREWRANPARAGGGELLDQGVHLIDLFRWMAGAEITTVQAHVAAEFWPIQPLEDTAYCLLRTASSVTCNLMVSLTEWKNRFQLELTGERGTLAIDGLGGSYGTETLTIVRRPELFGVPSFETTTFEDPERCWADEWQEFVSAVREGRRPLGDARDALAALRVIDACYRSSREGRTTQC